jgi:hypothetical protein
MDIALYIADLLRQHDEVNVPSLGTFYKQHKAGFYDADKDEFYPPSHCLSFRQSEDSTFLTEYISRQKNVSANTANYFIEKFVSQIKSLLDVYGRTDIEALGTLKKSTGGGYTLTGSQNLDTEGEYYGLMPVPEIRESQLKSEPVVVIHPTTEQVLSAASEENIPVAEQPDGDITEGTGKKISVASKIVLTAVSLILIGIITYLVYPQAFEMFRQKTDVPGHKIPSPEPAKATVSKTLADSIAEADTIYNELSKQGFEVEKPRDTLEVSTEVTAVPETGPAVTFEIIGAAFARRSEAETYVKQLTAKGVYARIVENMPGSKLKISLGTFNDEESAKKELIRIQKDLNKDAWIARVKTKKTN